MKSMMMLAVVAALAFCTGPVFAAEDLSAKIAAAKSAADHEALADAYTKEAEEAEANAKAHESMAKSYKGLGKAGQYHNDTHCAAIAASYRTQAKQLKDLAAAERAAAKAAK